MKNAVTRACAWVSLGLMIQAPFAKAQTASLEVYAGGGRPTNAEGLNTPITPGGSAFGPDGQLYVVNKSHGQLVALDLASGLANGMPRDPGRSLDYVSDIAFRQNSAVVVIDNRIYQADLFGGYTNFIAGGAFNGRRDCGGSSSFPASYADLADIKVISVGTYRDFIVAVDRGNNNVCLISPFGSSTLLAGSPTGSSGNASPSGPARGALLSNPSAVIVDPTGSSIYIADTGNARIRRVTLDASSPFMTTVVGTGNRTFNGDDVPVYLANLDRPTALALDADNNLVVYDSGALRLRKIAGGRVTTIAGHGEYGFDGDGGPATEASFSEVESLARGPDGDLYLSDVWNKRVRHIRHVTGIVDTVLGNGETAYCGEDKLPRQTCLDAASGIAADPWGAIYVSDTGNGRIRKQEYPYGTFVTIAGKGASFGHGGDDGPAIDATFGDPRGLALDAASNLYIAAGYDHRIRRIDKELGTISTIAGTGVPGFSGDGGPATAAQLNVPDQLVVDSVGNLLIADQLNHRIRRIDAATGVITTIAGTGEPNGPLGDGGPATQASLYYPKAIALDQNDNVFVFDSNHFRVRRIDAQTGVITTVAGNGSSGIAGDGGPATAAAIGSEVSLYVDPPGNIFLTSAFSLRKVDRFVGYISKVGPWVFSTPEGFQMQRPNQMARNSSGQLLITDPQLDLVFSVSGLSLERSDDSPPFVFPTVVGTRGSDGWYTSDIQISWTVQDWESVVRNKQGCDTVTVTADGQQEFTCTATSAGGTVSIPVYVGRDATAPTLTFGAITPAPDANGWSNGDTSIPFTTFDATSGVASTNLPSPLQFSDEGVHVSRSITVTDSAGNSATYESPAISLDRTAPQVSAQVVGPHGNGDWFRGDVHVDWSVNEIPTSIVSTNGCVDQDVLADTTGLTFSCTVTSAGGTASESVTVRRDASPPMIVWGVTTPEPDASGWNSTEVTIPFLPVDQTSGIASSTASSPIVLSQEGVGIRREVTVTDAAGNSTTNYTQPVNIDRSPPVIDYRLSGISGNNGWYRSDVTLNWQISEMPVSIRSINGCESRSIADDTTGSTFTCTIVSAGGTTSKSVTIKRDATPPTLSWGAFSPAPNASGWNKTNVSVPFTATDASSGVATTSGTSPLTISTEGANVTGQVTVTDIAGNSQTFTTNPRNIDKTAPLVTITSPANGATYGFYQDVYADFECTDVSLLSCAGTNAEGAAVNTKTAGVRTFKVTAKDSVAFTTAVTNSYTVASTFNFDGFLGAAPSPAPNVVRKGSLVPLRWRLPDGHGGFVTSTASYSSVASTTVSCPAGAVAYNDTATGGSGISFNAATNAFTYNWQSSSSFTGCKQIFITLKDGTQHDLVFKFQ